MDKKRILVVDDEPEFVTIVKQRIESWGYEVTGASSGKEALTVINDGKADAVILDYMMPEMNGVETLREIRKKHATLPVIMFTAYPDAKVIDGTDQLGISAFIPKLTGQFEAALNATLDMIFKKAK